MRPTARAQSANVAAELRRQAAQAQPAQDQQQPNRDPRPRYSDFVATFDRFIRHDARYFMRNMNDGIHAFARFPNGADILKMESWVGMPVTDRDLIMFAAGSANQLTPQFFAQMMASGASLETTVQVILSGAAPVDVQHIYARLPWFPVQQEHVSDHFGPYRAA